MKAMTVASRWMWVVAGLTCALPVHGANVASLAFDVTAEEGTTRIDFSAIEWALDNADETEAVSILPVGRAFETRTLSGLGVEWTLPDVDALSAQELSELFGGAWEVKQMLTDGSVVTAGFEVDAFEPSSVPDPRELRITAPDQGATVGPAPFTVAWDGGALDEDNRLSSRQVRGQGSAPGAVVDFVVAEGVDLSGGEAPLEVERIRPDPRTGTPPTPPFEAASTVHVAYVFDTTDAWVTTPPDAVFDEFSILLTVERDWSGSVVVPEPATASLVPVAFLALGRRSASSSTRA